MPTRARTNAEWSALTRAALLEAARRLFAEQGYEQASLDVIAAAASLTKGSIYHHYGDKHGLFRGVFEEVQRDIVQRVDAVAIGASSYFDGILLGCEAFLEAVLDQGVARIVLTDAPSVLGWGLWRATDYEIGGRSLQAGIEAAIAGGEIERVDPVALTTFISGALNETALSIAEAEDATQARQKALATVRWALERLRSSPA